MVGWWSQSPGPFVATDEGFRSFDPDNVEFERIRPIVKDYLQGSASKAQFNSGADRAQHFPSFLNHCYRWLILTGHRQ
jgi:hypothetical protein